MAAINLQGAYYSVFWENNFKAIPGKYFYLHYDPLQARHTLFTPSETLNLPTKLICILYKACEPPVNDKLGAIVDVFHR